MLKNLRNDLEEVKLQTVILDRYWNPEEQTRLLNFYVRIIPVLTAAERCGIFIVDPADEQVWLKAGTGVTERQIEVPSASSLVGKVIQSGEPLHMLDLDHKSGVHKETDAATGFITRELLSVPIYGLEKGEVIGAIELLNKRSGTFSEDDKALLTEVARYISLYVEHIYLNQHIATLSGKLYRAEKRAMSILLIALVVAAGAVFLFFMAWWLVPVFF
jgi:GAF domain-containing protein